MDDWWQDDDPIYRNREGRRRPPHLLTVIAVALIFSLVGSMATVYLLFESDIFDEFVQGRLQDQVARALEQQLGDIFPAEPNGGSDAKLSAFDAVAWPVTEVAAQVSDSVVSIVSLRSVRDMWGNRELVPASSGTGAIIDEKGHVVTNYHVIEGADGVEITLADGRGFSAEIVGFDAPTDLAVLKIDATNMKSLQFADSEKLVKGQLAIAIGNPSGPEFQQSVTVGVISGLNRRIGDLGGSTSQIGERNFNLIQTDAAINPGNSGGPLLDSAGKVIGINSAKFVDESVEGMGFAIPSNTVKRVTSDIIEHGKVRRVWLGVFLVTKEQARAREEIPDFSEGIMVHEIVSGGPADKAGAMAEDIILEIEGQRVDSFADLASALETFAVGQEISLSIQRDGQEMVLKITLEEMPEATP